MTYCTCYCGVGWSGWDLCCICAYLVCCDSRQLVSHQHSLMTYNIAHKIGSQFYCFVFLWLFYESVVELYHLNSHVLQGYFTGTGAILRLPQCQWSNPEGYGYNPPVPHHNKPSTLYICSGIYSMRDSVYSLWPLINPILDLLLYRDDCLSLHDN